MKKMKRFAVVLCIAALVLSLTGCAMTPEKMIEKIEAAYAGKTLTGFDMAMTLDASMEAAGETINMAGEIGGTIQYIPNESGTAEDAYMDMEYEMSMEEQTLRDGIQVYMETEGEEQTAFVHMDSTDAWSRTDTPAITMDTAEVEASVNLLDALDLSTLTLAEETQQINGTVTYVVNGTLTGQYIQDRLNTELEAMGDEIDAMMAEYGMEGFDLSTIDFSILEMPFTAYVDKESFEIVQVEMSINNFDTLFNGMVDSIMGILPEGTVPEGENLFSLTFNELSYVVSNFQFDATEVPTVSEEGRILASQASFNPDLGDGTYVIQESGNAVQITAKEDWAVQEMAYYAVSFMNKSETQSATFEIYNTLTTDDCLAYVTETVVPQVQATGYLRGHSQGEEIAGFATYHINYGGTHMYYAWKNHGDAVLFITVLDVKNATPASALTSILEGITDYEVSY